MGTSVRIPAGLVLVATLMGVVLTAGGAVLSMAQEEQNQQEVSQIQKEEVDQACAVSRVQLAVYEDALGSFHEATAEWDIVFGRHRDSTRATRCDAFSGSQ